MSAGAAIRVERGHPDPTQLAVVTVLLLAMGAARRNAGTTASPPAPMWFRSRDGHPSCAWTSDFPPAWRSPL